MGGKNRRNRGEKGKNAEVLVARKPESSVGASALVAGKPKSNVGAPALLVSAEVKAVSILENLKLDADNFPAALKTIEEKVSDATIKPLTPEQSKQWMQDRDKLMEAYKEYKKSLLEVSDEEEAAKFKNSGEHKLYRSIRNGIEEQLKKSLEIGKQYGKYLEAEKMVNHLENANTKYQKAFAAKSGIFERYADDIKSGKIIVVMEAGQDGKIQGFSLLKEDTSGKVKKMPGYYDLNGNDQSEGKSSLLEGKELKLEHGTLTVGGKQALPLDKAIKDYSESRDKHRKTLEQGPKKGPSEPAAP